MRTRDLDDLAWELHEWTNRANLLLDYNFKNSPDNISLNEAEAGISNEGEDWSIISLSCKKSEIVSCLKDQSLSIEYQFGFNEALEKVVTQACQIVDHAPQTGLTLDDEIKLFYNDEQAKKAIEDEQYQNQKLRHMVFMLFLKARRDRLRAVMSNPLAPNSAKAVRFAQLWLPIESDDIYGGIAFMHVRSLWSQNAKKSVPKEGGNSKKFKCIHCLKEFTEIDLAEHILSGEGLIFEFCSAEYFNEYGKGTKKSACPICGLPLDKEKLANGEYDASVPWCFVASVVFSPDSYEVQILREIRDKWLINLVGGRVLVSSYYRCGPLLAHFVGRSRILRQAAKIAIRLVIGLGLRATGRKEP
ncbi:MAG: CFI-box-CTERM domain-containing protein [Candidatus Glassbacteria bacterium]